LTAGRWQTNTMTCTITNSGNLSLGFYWTAGDNSYLDSIGNVTMTPAVTPSPPTVSGIAKDGLGKVILTGTSTGTGVITEKSTNLAVQPIVWTRVSTNPVTGSAFRVTNSIGADPRAFFRVKNQ
jgi:hypothetical protein